MAYIISNSSESRYADNHAVPIDGYEPLKQFLRFQSSFSKLNCGRRLPDDKVALVPRHYKIRAGTRFYDWNDFAAGKGVSQRFMELVESIEPHVHQFFPAELFLSDGVTPYGEPFWIMNVTTRVDAICLERSTMYERGKDEPELTPDQYFTGYSQYVVRAEETDGRIRIQVSVYKDRIQGRALWCDYRFGASIFCSDEMMARMREIGIEGYDIHSEIKHIDEI
jgi:hypothetical protein